MKVENNDLRKELTFFKKIFTWFGVKSVIVLTMGKVGTLTVCKSLERIGYHHVHPHSMFYSWPGTHFIRVDLNSQEKVKYTIKTILKRVKVFFWRLVKRNIIIITGVRDPYSRAISAYFEQIHYAGGIPSFWDYEDIKKDFDSRVSFFSTLEWFDKEVKKLTKIDVFEYQFDKDKGCAVIKSGRWRLFIFRLDKLDSLSNEIGHFLGVDEFRISIANKTEENEYALQYKNFKENYKFCKSISREFERSEFFKHFYKDEEIAELKNKWVSS